MEHELYNKIKNNNPKAVEELFKKYLKRSWFISYYITENPGSAAALLIASWKNAFDGILSSASPPSENFGQILFSKLLSLSGQKLEPDDTFDDLNAPEVSSEYDRFVEEIRSVSLAYRSVYLIHNYAGLSKSKISVALGIAPSEVERVLTAAQKEITEKSSSLNDKDWSKRVKLFTQFKNPTGSGFNSIDISEILVSKLSKTLYGGNADINKTDRKEIRKMQSAVNKPYTGRKSKSKKKGIIITVIVAAVVIAALLIFLVPRIIRATQASASSTTTYNVQSVTTGDVDTTVSGSGTLSPVTNSTLSKEYPVTVTTLNYSVGDEISSGDVIAVVTSDLNGEENITAPYDCILIEQPVAAEDSIEANSEIAMVMGKDGYTMDVSVDELNITSIEVGQEVTFDIDAIDDEQTGEVTAVSYNGTTSGSSTSYKITTKVDYIEGVYPGMSASAEIVIESSGEGLLVPVDAVKTSGDDNYVYLAPDGASDGDEYEEDDIDVDSLTKVDVTTGMSDGTYIIIESDDISDGDLILIETITTNQTVSGDSDDNGFGSFGGGDFSGGGDIDMSNFDPSNIPQGGGGNMPGGSGSSN